MRILTPLELNPDIELMIDPYTREISQANLDYYKTVGFAKPWIAYLLREDDIFVGTCAFKGGPVEGKVEIAYHTFPPFEGRGHATFMCQQLVALAEQTDAEVTITARTLPEENASTHILRRCGFECVGVVEDPEDGAVYEWVYRSQY